MNTFNAEAESTLMLNKDKHHPSVLGQGQGA